MKNNVIREIAFKYLKESKKKNFIIGIIIALVSSFLICVMLFGNSLNEGTKKIENKYAGSFHATISNLSENDANNISHHALIQDIAKRKEYGIEEIDNEKIHTEFLEKKYLEGYGRYILEGKLPSNKNEIVLSTDYLNKKSLKVGDKIKTKENYTYEITGSIDPETAYSEEKSVFEGIVSEERAKESNIEYEIGITVNEKNIEEDINNIVKDFKIDQNNVQVNSYLLNKSNYSIENILLYSIIIILILLSSFFIIYNLFSINFVSRIKTIGLLKTLGCTRKQVKSLLRWEGILLSLISIPIGIIVGYGLSYIIIPLAPVTFKVELYSRWWFVPLTVVLVLSTVLLSIMVPERKAVKLSPVEASKINSMEKINIKSGKPNKSIYTYIAKINLWRNKKTTIITLISLILSCTLFLTISTVLGSMNIYNLAKSVISEDINISTPEEIGIDENVAIEENILKEIEKIKDIKAYKTYKAMTISVPNNEQYYSRLLGTNEYGIQSINKEDVLEGSLDLDLYKNSNKIILAYNESIVGKLPYNIGDIIKVDTFEFEDNMKVNKRELEFEVAAIVKDINTESAGIISLLTYEKNNIFDNINGYSSIDIKTDNCEDVKNKISPILGNKTEFQIKTIDEIYEKLDGEYFGMQLIGNIIVGMIGIVAIINFISSIVSSLLARKKEFGLIRAIGITENEVKKIIYKEGIMLGSIIIFASVILGNSIGYLLYLLLKTQASYPVYKFALTSNIFMIILVVIIEYFIYKNYAKTIVKESVIEQIKNEE